MIFDTHAHIYDEAYQEDYASFVEKIKKEVDLLLIPADNLISSKKILKLIEDEPSFYGALGIHPSEVEKEDISTCFDRLEEMVKSSSKIKAIGEIGLDYYWNKEEDFIKLQKIFFIKQIQLANKLSLPVIIHSRDACEDTLKILEDNPPLFGCVFHCFSYSKEVLDIIIKRGYYIGLDGPVTYKNAINPKLVAASVPLDRLLVETDSPYLTPTPFRGKVNSPSFVKYVMEEIAKLRNEDIAVIEKATFENGIRFFNIGDYNDSK